MDIQQLVSQLKVANKSKIVMLVADGLGGLPIEPGGPTELEAAKTPNLDALAKRGVQGSMNPIAPGITPGSGPGHLGLFGYDPVKHLIGRGALEATGVGFKLGPKDVAVRCNFCTLDAAGNISDRRAGRIPSEESAPLAIKLRQVKIPGVEVFVEPVKEHRFVVIFRGEGLGGNVADTDPQQTGVPPLDPVAHDAKSQRTAETAKQFVAQAQKLLAGQPKANGLTLRGFAAAPVISSYEDVYGLKAAAIAVYPMYKGLAQLVGMEVVGYADDAQRGDRRAGKGVEQLRLLLRPLQVHRQPRRGRQLRREGADDRAVRRDRAACGRFEADGADRDRRPQHARPAGQPQLASGADAVGIRHLPARRVDGLWRAASPSRRAGPIPGGLSHAPGHGARGTAGKVRGVKQRENRPAEGDSPIFADFAAKIGTVPVNGYPSLLLSDQPRIEPVGMVEHVGAVGVIDEQFQFVGIA